jgi:lysophospholipase L1-like esterase
MIPLFSEQKNDIIENCKKNLQKIIQQAHEINAKVILSTVFPLGELSIERKLLGMKELPIMDAIDEVNVFIKSLASEATLIFDAYALLKTADGRKIDERYSRDWLHLNERGYKVLNKEIVKLL